jgi:hypothetical protein
MRTTHGGATRANLLVFIAPSNRKKLPCQWLFYIEHELPASPVESLQAIEKKAQIANSIFGRELAHGGGVVGLIQQ